MARYRVITYEVQAILCKEAMEKGLPNWLKKDNVIVSPKGIYITTLEGFMMANPEDYIIQGIKGELYPCKPEIFAAIHEQINDNS